MADATGLAQFWNAIGEMARGALAPSVHPVWQRELLGARDPPRITCQHNEFSIDRTRAPKQSHVPFEGMAHSTFLLGPAELSIIGRYIPPHFSHSKFEALTSCLWRCKAIAFQADPEEQVGTKIAVNARSKFKPPLPTGYYGNALAHTTAVTTAGRLFQGDLGQALETIRDAENMVTEEYMRSLANLTALNGRQGMVQSFYVSDVRHAAFGEVDYGWGRPAFAGQPKGWMRDHIPGAAAAYLPFKNGMGEHGVMMLVSLPKSVMERFVLEFEKMLKHEAQPSL